MSEIALYNLLKRIPDATDDEVEKAVADVASTKEVATKADLAEQETRLMEKIADAKHTMIMWVVGVGIAVVGIIIAVLK